ncbi:hypothetical protein [Vulgatibacter sp.]|uniref:hypothetical protein n=1 Tax=Vulgatibacter sp. TaxID=1971226 RepID=UPI0035620761
MFFNRGGVALLLAALATAGVACSEDEKPQRVAGNPGGSGGGGGSGGSGGETPRPEGPALGDREQLGAWLGAPPRAALVGNEKPLLVVGTSAVLFDPAHFGRAEVPATTVELAVGLLVVDTSTGEARVLGEDDGVPVMRYGDASVNLGEAATSIFDLDWVTVDERFVAAGYQSLIAADVAADGSFSFQHVKLRAEGKTADAVVFQTAVVGDLVFAGGDQGLAIASAENLEVQAWVDFGAPDRTIHALAAGMLAGEGVVAVLHGDTDAPVPNSIGLAKADGSFVSIPVPEGFLPTSAVVTESRALFGFMTPEKTGAIYQWKKNAEEVWTFEQVAGPMELTTDGERYPVVPGLLVHDPTRRELLVGGRIVQGAIGGPGGGLVYLAYTEDAGIYARATDILPKQEPYFEQLPWQFDVIVPDGKGSLFIAGRQLCNEHKMRQLPLLQLRRAEGAIELIRPWIDGVRSVAIDPKNGETWLGLRSELPGMACEGIAVSQSLCRLKADGSCLVTTPRVNADADFFAPMPGAAAVAFGDPDRNQIAVASVRDALFVQDGALSHAISSQIDPGLNLRLTAAAFDDEVLWVSSIFEHDKMYDEKVNDRGPHGVGLFQLNEEAKPKPVFRYVRTESDLQEEIDVPGLPSNMAYDVLPLGKARALVALGIERVHQSYDHIIPAPAENDVGGGVAIVEAETVEVIAAPEGSAMRDVVALARGEGDVIYALDANEGIFTIDVEAKTAARWSTATWEAPVRALSLAADTEGHLAVGTTDGLHVFGADTGVTEAIVEMAAGYVWSVDFVAPGVLYAGTDEGLHRIAVGDRELPAKGPATLDRWPFPLEVQICGTQGGCVCTRSSQCATGSDCACTDAGEGFACTCTEADRCVAEPGADRCACDPADPDPCVYQLECLTDERGNSSCEVPPPPPCDGTEGCPCSAEEDCAEGYECNFAFRLCQLAGGPQACMDDCTCTGENTTQDGCPIGYHCQGQLGGGSMCEVDPT